MLKYAQPVQLNPKLVQIMEYSSNKYKSDISSQDSSGKSYEFKIGDLNQESIDKISKIYSQDLM